MMRPAPYPNARPAPFDALAQLQAVHVEARSEWIAAMQPDGLRRFCGVQICDMGWTETLAYVELVSNLRQNARTLSFVDSRAVLRLSLDAGCRAVLGRRILLPASRSLDVAARLGGGDPFKTRFDATRFVDALLTFVPRCHVALVGARLGRLEAMRAHLSGHAPWHMLSVVRAADLGSGIAAHGAVAGYVGSVPDVVIVDSDGYHEEVRFEQAVGLRHNGLIIMAGTAFDGRGR
ncbi:hypothetical protein ACQKKX_17445 [Neorhizobium sp. NPDC001467]|uniref:hypothetical protein n=1 Tax=Neorhizobium sp. NPDC001467 TaxID=3390595 RepID=UPI003D056993